jgi:hypothetical protein
VPHVAHSRNWLRIFSHFEVSSVGPGQSRTSLISGKPIPSLTPNFFTPFNASDACSKLGAEETGVGCFAREPSYSGESCVDRSRRELPILE